ncbi:MAG: hypothetical protein IPM63_09070 [Acidobacteriota bacterium]|nr:MAG: hypothetical protein IPM63_09070 [Acidobacteriota bacterium]
MAYILMVSVLLMLGCGAGTGQIAESKTTEGLPKSPAAQNISADKKSPRESSFEDAEGVVVFDGSGNELKSTDWRITLYGEDGAPWRVIDYNDDSLESLEGEEGDFFPMLFSNGNKRDFGIELRLVRRSDDWFEVIAHESREPKTRAYIRTDDPLFKALGWEEWVMVHKNLTFDRLTNPVLDSPDGAPKAVAFAEMPLIKPDKVSGEWVLVRWTQMEPDEPSVDWIRKNLPENSGWIRWRKDGKILISEYYP